jgi:hypothetical protein
MQRRKPTITEAYEWIAHNDEPDEMDEEVVAGFVTVALVADVFGATTTHVAKRVIQIRKRMAR